MSKSFSVENYILEKTNGYFSMEDVRVGILKENHIIVTVEDIDEVLSSYVYDNIVLCNWRDNTFKLCKGV